jgi:hypothetical protein
MTPERTRWSSLTESSVALGPVPGPMNFRPSCRTVGQFGCPHQRWPDSFFMDCWVEQPLTTGAAFLVPRILQRTWSHISHSVVEYQAVLPQSLPDDCSYRSDIPFVLLVVLPHIRIPPPDLEEAPSARAPPSGSANKLKVCTGCEEPFTAQRPLGYGCDFRVTGFQFTDGTRARPCDTAYHGRCIQAGPPFRTRLPNGKGLCFPHNVPIPHFVCECCQVRGLLNRELDATARDVALLMLERMRMIDIISNWRETTLGQYSPALRSLQAFEKWSGVPTLVPTTLTRPPTGRIYGIVYAQLCSTLPKRGKEEGIKYDSSRKLRSAASMWYNLDMQLCYPAQAVRDQQRRCYLTVQTTPSDALAFTFLNTGMARRMGDATQPSWTLNHAHITFLDRRFEELWCLAVTEYGRHELATAACANLVAWFGWLRGGELFGLAVSDVLVTTPAHGLTLGLPLGVGVVQVRLAPETKSNPTRTADVVVAYQSGSGLSLGKWMERVLTGQCGVYLFSTQNRSRWSSSYFRHEYAFPLLE